MMTTDTKRRFTTSARRRRPDGDSHDDQDKEH
jgi:hypothetical protein